jgi:hypothetical protein
LSCPPSSGRCVMRVTMSGLHNIRIDQRGVHQTIHGQNSEVAAYIRMLGEKVTIEAKLLAGVRTGRLKRSIKMKRDRSVPGEFAVLVGSDVRHALVHHEGSRPHVITAKGQGGLLKFRGRNGMVYVHQVKHPGTRPNQYLVRALRRVIRGRGM